MPMRRVQQIASVAVLALGAFLLVGALELRYFTSIGPGPGFFPVWLAAILCGLAVLMLVEATFGGTDGAPADLPAPAGVLRIGTIVVALVGAALLLDRLGFAPAMFLMNLFLLLALGRHGRVTVLAVSALGSFGIGWVFTQGLKVPLPTGKLGSLCPQILCGA